MITIALLGHARRCMHIRSTNDLYQKIDQKVTSLTGSYGPTLIYRSKTLPTTDKGSIEGGSDVLKSSTRLKTTSLTFHYPSEQNFT